MTPFQVKEDYLTYGFKILEILQLTESPRTTWYRVFWPCCSRDTEHNHFSLTERIKRYPAGIDKCTVCLRSARALENLEKGTAPSIRRHLPKGIISAAVAWPRPKC